MILECKNCGAPLDVEAGSSFARCKYCGKTQRVTRERTQLPQTPPNWRPPVQWTPPPHFPARSVPLRYDAGKKLAKVIVAVVLVTTLAPFVMIAAIFGIVAVLGARATSSTPSSPPRSRAPEPKSKPSPAPAGGSACEAAARCCDELGTQATGCANIAAVPNEETCKRVLEALRDAAEAMGKSCD